MDAEKPKSNPEIARDIIKEYLHERGLRVTPERRAIVDIVFEQQGHFTIDDARASLAKKRFSVSIATLYNNMEMFTDMGIVSRHFFGATMQYERRLGVEPHFHRICKVCGKVEDLHNDRWMHVMEQTSIRGFKCDYYQCYVYGTCSRCMAALRRKNKKAIKK